MCLARLFTAWCLSAGLLAAAPNLGAVVNAASYAAGPLAPGSVAAIFGSDLASAPVSAKSYPLPKYLGGVSVYVNGMAAPLLYVSPGQVNFQVPWDSRLGQSTVAMIANDAASNALSVAMAAAAPALLNGTALSSAWGQPLTAGATQTRAARSGEYITLFATGLGAVSPQPKSGDAPPSTISPTIFATSVTIGGMQAVVGYAGLAPLGPNPYVLPGLYQVNALVPEGAPAGDAIPVTISVNGVPSNSIPISIASGRADSYAKFVELGPNGSVVARAITSEMSCPKISLDGAVQTMAVRSAASIPFYPVTICEAAIPTGAMSASIEGVALALPAQTIARVTVMGDTGCRMDTSASQGCYDAKAWPAAQIAQSALATSPQLLIHNGDYHYRENPCMGTAACQGSPWGYNWDVWREDLFKPLQNLLPSAPWVFVRGNHESCDRAGEGWFRFLDPRPMPTSCAVYTDPYSITAGPLQLIHIDSAQADDATAVPDQVAAYASQFDMVRQMAGSNAWILTHRPLWGIRSNLNANVVMQAASQNILPAGVQLVLSGHTHTFQTYTFAPARAPQVVVGNSGDNLAAAPGIPLVGAIVGNATVVNATSLGGYGFATMAAQSDGSWAIVARDTAGSAVASCQMKPNQVTCDK